MLALTSATGKLGSAVLKAILDNNLAGARELVVCVRELPLILHPDWLTHKQDFIRPKRCKIHFAPGKNITIRYANYDEPSSLENAFAGCDKLFLVSTPRISMDFNNAPLWKGREAHHHAAIDAARKVGVKHIYYTSLAFQNPSKASVMQAHIRTEAYLQGLEDVKYTVIREGLYNESWPLYFGYYRDLKKDARKEIVVAGDGPISWTAIQDMAFGTAKIVCAPSEKWEGKPIYLSQNKTWTLKDIANIVSKVRGEEVSLKVVSRDEYEKYYVEERGIERPSVEWWSNTYGALKDGECDITDTTLEDILKEAGRRPKPVEETIEEMLK